MGWGMGMSQKTSAKAQTKNFVCSRKREKVREVRAWWAVWRVNGVQKNNKDQIIRKSWSLLRKGVIFYKCRNLLGVQQWQPASLNMGRCSYIWKVRKFCWTLFLEGAIVDADKSGSFLYLWSSMGIGIKRKGIPLDLFTPGTLKWEQNKKDTTGTVNKKKENSSLEF